MEPSVVYTASSRRSSRSTGRAKSASARLPTSSAPRDGSMTARSTATNASSMTSASRYSGYSSVTARTIATAASNMAPDTSRMSVRSSATTVSSVSTARLHSDRSWYNTLRNNHTTKPSATIKDAEPVHRVTAAAEHARNTKYNPVLGRYRFKQEDKTKVNQEAWTKKVKLERAIAADVRYGTNYDIVTFAARRGKPCEEKPPKERPNLPNYPGAKYDIVTLKQQPNGTRLHPNAAPESLEEIAAKKLAARKSNKPRAVEKAEKRNPVNLEGAWSEKGREEVPAYSEEDIAAIAEAAATAVVNNGRSSKIGGAGANVAYHRGRREYDPVNHKFLDETVEAAVQSAEAEASQEKAESRFKGLPTAEKDGAGVDIVTGYHVDPISGEKGQDYVPLEHRPSRRPKKAMVDEGLKAKQAAEEAALNSARRMNRLADERFYGADVQRGYDVITLETWDEAPNKGPAITKDAKPKSSYQKLLDQQRRLAAKEARQKQGSSSSSSSKAGGQARRERRSRPNRPVSAPAVSTARSGASAASAGGFSSNNGVPMEARRQSRPEGVSRLSLAAGSGGENPFAKVKVQAAPVQAKPSNKQQRLQGGKKARRRKS